MEIREFKITGIIQQGANHREIDSVISSTSSIEAFNTFINENPTIRDGFRLECHNNSDQSDTAIYSNASNMTKLTICLG
ncbi:hypothetical protein C9J44_20540 [Photobacterium sp. GB-27]|nr:hypothetical protein C9J42_16705 [Photobacterium sp. GB-56]PSV29315.1 hypothetical protein C9J40_17975 [Photobacterium sp. GB-72]PSV30729.1 hypothetical protein C9J44_20540 [Photobacterium sp. GB-27]PSV32230.1 hypothetical protein C9J38_21040 [Photobacterium sp. GB-210]PSV42058.1 hypothetical protein C9J46_15575 [Photobacterium sp. GB-36]PSV50285.1 hypothetical protein C9J45_20900 [Photobacterium sp. GB-1]PSV57509.1 hypothetical protein C9J43_07285 [Photobacterium sp. GB-3]PSW74227.1 hypo